MIGSERVVVVSVAIQLLVLGVVKEMIDSAHMSYVCFHSNRKMLDQNQRGRNAHDMGL
jgi:flagellar biogenesis protein FliO